jgi:galactokinase
MQVDTSAIKDQFQKTFGTAGGAVHVVRAPGRVNLIGEHTDYNDGFVFPMAIEPHVLFAFRARADGLVRMVSTVYPDQFVEFSVNEPIERGEPKWSNYIRGAAAQLVKAGIPLVGMDLLLDNTLPIGGGLSSSAALEVGMARALLKLAGLEMDETRIALLCQKAEHEYALVPSGIMDQTIVTSGRAGHVMLLDCRDNSKQHIPLDPNELRVVIVNSMVKHELTGGEYAERRQQCEQGVAFFQKADPAVTALRDVTMKQVEAAKGQLDDVIFRRCRHVVGENARATNYATLLSSEQYERAGQLMVQSHDSLRDDYNVSTPELDYLVTESMTIKGVYGARMTGGGFGGCIVALTQPRAVAPLSDHLNEVYAKQIGERPAIYVTTATNGAEVIE